MSFAAPIWLAALVPWAALVAWMLIGRRPRADVPFIELWRGWESLPRAKRALRAPPVSVILLLFATLCSIFAAARLWLAARAGNDVVAVVDQTARMTPAVRVAEVARLLEEIRPREAMRVAGPIEPAIRDALVRGGPVVVITEQPVEVQSDRVVRIVPQSVPQNAGIVRLSVRETPSPQVMVRLRNQSNHRAAELIVSTASSDLRTKIALPPAGEEANFFADTPAVDRWLSVELNLDDDFPPDNRAWLARGRSWAKISPASPLPPELDRIVRVYEESRGGQPADRELPILVGSPIDPGKSAIIIAPRATWPIDHGGQLRIVEHPIASQVDWAGIVRDVTVAEAPGSGWTPIVSVGDQVLVAVRDTPARQMWVGFDSPTWARTSDFVIFWAEVFDWAGERTDEFVAEPVRSLGKDWTRVDPASSDGEPRAMTAGLWEGPNASLRALNVTDVRFDQSVATEWRKQLAGVRAARAGTQLDLSGMLGLAAVVLAASGLALAGVSRGRQSKLDSV
jgi:hypothetical protein